MITFHSLEDRLTKTIFKEYSTVDVPKGLPMIPKDMEAKLKLVNRKPVLASEEELAFNNRAHSAKLRVAEKQKIKLMKKEKGERREKYGSAT